MFLMDIYMNIFAEVKCKVQGHFHYVWEDIQRKHDLSNRKYMLSSFDYKISTTNIEIINLIFLKYIFLVKWAK